MRKSVATGIVLLLLLAGVFAAASQVGWAPSSPSPSPGPSALSNTTYPVLSASTETPPTIDGVMSTGEWDDADTVLVFSSTWANSTIYVMNDEDNLYIALSVFDATFTSTDSVSVRFDNDHNHVTDEDDDKAWTYASTYTDRHFEAAAVGWGTLDSQTDGSGAGGTTGGTNFFEISKPLKSGDPEDFNLTVGDTVGACLSYFDDGIAYSKWTVYPVDGRLAVNAQAKYFDIQIAPVSPIGLLNDLKDYIDALDDDDFSNKNHRKTLVNKINSILNSINLTDIDSINSAIDKLTNDILPKTDGEHPPPDWITDPTAQQEVEDMILYIIETLEYIASTLGP
jgi:hypothetical protein